MAMGFPLFLLPFLRLECKDTQIRGKGKKGSMDGWRMEEIQFSYGNLVRCGRAGCEIPSFLRVLIDVTMASKSSPAIPHLVRVCLEAGREKTVRSYIQGLQFFCWRKEVFSPWVSFRFCCFQCPVFNEQLCIQNASLPTPSLHCTD